MKGIPIKFRIKTDNNEDLYLTPSLNGDYDQLIGYDADGNEVYEGDKLFDEEHNTYVTAELYPGVHTQFYRKV